MVVSFTGHRPDKINNVEEEKKLLLKTLKSILGEDLNLHSYIVGGCPGFDTVALELLLQENVDRSKILLAVPFRGFELYAGKTHEKENQRVLSLNYTCGVPFKEVGGREGSFGQKTFKRNMFMVDNSEMVVTNHDGSNGGTANTVKYALKTGKRVVNVKDYV